MKQVVASRALMLAVVIGLSGCALINPYPKSQQYQAYQPRQGYRAYREVNGPGLVCPAIEHGLDKAACERIGYEKYLRQHGYANSLNAIALLGLASTIAYKGANISDSQKNVSALTIGGAAWYAGYGYLYKRPREAIYVSGILALDCASEQAQQWLAVEPETFSQHRLHALASVQAMQIKVDAANSSRDLARSEASRSECQSASPDLLTEQARLDALTQRLALLSLEQHEDTLVVEHAISYQPQMRRNYQQADTNLKYAVDAIHDEVLSQLQKEQPDPSALATRLAVFVPANPAPADTKAKGSASPAKSSILLAGQAPQNLLEFLNHGIPLHPKACDLSRRNDLLESIVQAAEQYRHPSSATPTDGPMFDADSLAYLSNAMAAAPGDPAVVGHYPQCAALASAGGGPLQLTQHATDPWPLKEADTLQIAFTGGKPPYTATVLTPPDKGEVNRVIATSPSGLGYVLYLSVTKGTTPGLYTIMLTDSVGSSQVIQFKLE